MDVGNLVTLGMRTIFGVMAALTFLSCAATRPRTEAAQVQPSARPSPLTFSADRLDAPRTPRLSEEQEREVRAVLAATAVRDRPTLFVSLIREVGRPDVVEMFFGDPRFSNGIVPPGVYQDKATVDGVPVSMVAAFHAVGEPCNVFYRPSTGELITVSGDGAGCRGWKPSAADRALQVFRTSEHAVSQTSVVEQRYFRLVDIGKARQPQLTPTELADVRAVEHKVPRSRWSQVYYIFTGSEGYPADQFVILELPTGPPKGPYSGQVQMLSVLNMSCIVEFNPVTRTIFTATSC
jgi:hypothetical protein